MTAAARFFAHRWLQAFVFGAVAACLYGGWAFWANRASPDQAVSAALAQGALSFATTMGVTWLMNLLFALGRTRAQRLGYTVVGTPLVVGVVSYLAHALAGTPNILLTIAPSVGLGAGLGSLLWAMAALKARPATA